MLFGEPHGPGQLFQDFSSTKLILMLCPAIVQRQECRQGVKQRNRPQVRRWCLLAPSDVCRSLSKSAGQECARRDGHTQPSQTNNLEDKVWHLRVKSYRE